ncbi:MAG: hypothetical protein QNJ97_02670 [Myxococcota bacterium]|nr:hypothetical protein [Myxococcota bacterium]
MRTSDLASQAYMPQVAAAFRKTAGQTKFLVLSIEPSEAPFVEAYATFENLPFPIGVADPMVGQGRTALGQVPAIPATYLLDESGRPTEAALGVVAAENLVAAIEQLEGR